MIQDNGYEVTHDGKCITVFSAPNYCDTMGNKGAFITLKGGDMTPNYTTYEGEHNIFLFATHFSLMTDNKYDNVNSVVSRNPISYIIKSNKNDMVV